jgi:hypothetical protein
MKPLTVRQLVWEHRYAAVYKCFNAPGASGAKEVSELAVVDGAGIGRDPNLTRVINALQQDLIFRRLHAGADNPTSRLMTFRAYPDGQPNLGRELLNAMLQAEDTGQVRKRSLALASRYAAIPGVREGVLIFLLSDGQLTGKDGAMTGRCLFVFKCDFEEISQIAAGELFRKIEEAIVEQTKKGGLYPYFELGQFHDDTVRVFDELGATQYWLEFLELGEYKSKEQSLLEVTLGQLGQTYPKLAEQYGKQLAVLEGAHSLVDADRVIGAQDRLPTAGVQALSDAILGESELAVTLQLGEVKVVAPLRQYGRTWIVAEDADQRYILIKGSELDNATRIWTPLDLVAFGALTDAAAELGISLAAGRGREDDDDSGSGAGR